MITKFQNFNLIKESPDTLYYQDKKGHDKENIYDDKDAKPFFFEVNPEHTKVEKIHTAKYGSTHGDIRFPKYGRENDRAYAGRLWKKSKLISFWVYPNEVLFKSIIEALKQKLKIKMFNNGWRIEVLKDDDKIKRRDPNDKNIDFYFGTRYNYKGGGILIPIEEYAGSENTPEEQRILHMMNWKEKEQAKKDGKLSIGNWGSAKTAWDQPHNIKYRQTIYQENNNS